ncbi:hypothetical protein BG05_5578 (plasmid) [Bacillus mycoides]|nr:hypothetical protein BG05_5578 [Bacillus mycoides]
MTSTITVKEYVISDVYFSKGVNYLNPKLIWHNKAAS